MLYKAPFSANGVAKTSRCYAVMDYYENRSLDAYIEEHRPHQGFSLAFIQTTLRQILQGLAHMHERRIMHRDVKSRNVLISKDGTAVVLADFGLSREFCIPVRTYTSTVMTIDHRPIELLLGRRAYSPAIDIWGVGCIFAQLCEGRLLIDSNSGYGSEIDCIFKIFDIFGTPVDDPYFSSLQHWQAGFPVFPGKPLDKVCPNLAKYSPYALDLFTVRYPI